MPWIVNPEFEDGDFEYSKKHGYWIPTASYKKRHWSDSWWFYNWRMIAIHGDNWKNEIRKKIAQ